MNANEKRAHFVKDLMWFVGGMTPAGSVSRDPQEATAAARRIAEALFPNEEPVGPSPVLDVRRIEAPLLAKIAEMTKERDEARASAGDWEVSHARLQKSSATQIKDLTEALQYWRELAGDREARMVSAIGALKEPT